MPVLPSETRGRHRSLRASTRAHLAQLRKARAARRIDGVAQPPDRGPAASAGRRIGRDGALVADTADQDSGRDVAIEPAATPAGPAEAPARPGGGLDGEGIEAPGRASGRPASAPRDATPPSGQATEQAPRSASTDAVGQVCPEPVVRNPISTEDCGSSAAVPVVVASGRPDGAAPHGETAAALSAAEATPSRQDGGTPECQMDTPRSTPDEKPSGRAPASTVAASRPSETRSVAQDNAGLGVGDMPGGDSDLSSLPGAGPGLVWLLGECGIHSMAELAAADAERLAARMGVIGELLDVGHWIELARRRS
jgi:predicted flap endonuclease-1-like 5' DNA nuclease